jgi:SAM-dependent methyltransferase
MKYPSHEIYEILYARYLEKGPDKLLSLAGDLHGKSVLDLCGGNGRISKRAIELGAKSVTLVDNSTEMVPSGIDNDCRIKVQCHDARSYISLLSKTPVCPTQCYDVVICQQAINYWFNQYTVGQLHRIIRKDGIFVFNTFNNKPSEAPVVKQYNYKNMEYVEVSWLAHDGLLDHKEMVNHVQICAGIEPHITKFMWISPEQFHNILLKEHFIVTEMINGPTSIYKCQVI